MRAFTNTPVTKEQLLASLKAHAAKDNFATGHYWEDFTQSGCGIGCSIHDFAPGEEKDHTMYETLFGIPTELAVLEDQIFEKLHSPVHRKRWPLEFIHAIPEGADLNQATGSWLLKMLDSGTSPFHPERHQPHIQSARHLLHHWLETGEMNHEIASDLNAAQQSPPDTAEPHALFAADLIEAYVANRTKLDPYTISDMFDLGTLCHQAAISHSEDQGILPSNPAEYRDSEAEAIHRISRLLLQALQEQS